MIYTDALQTVIMVGGALVLMFLGKQYTPPLPLNSTLIYLELSPPWFDWNFPKHRAISPLPGQGQDSLYAEPGV